MGHPYCRKTFFDRDFYEAHINGRKHANRIAERKEAEEDAQDDLMMVSPPTAATRAPTTPDGAVVVEVENPALKGDYITLTVKFGLK